jgi:phosphoribosylaminoimidazole-succinocarboxamide synthase
MKDADCVLSVNDDLPIRTEKPVHRGKVRSVYWLSGADSHRLIQQKNYSVPADSQLAIMVISDRISAFECIWHAEGNIQGVPGKGAALNAISSHWFDLFQESGLANNHILDNPHPLVWIVQTARPIMIEAIGRRYITGSMWRAYARGERNFCGIALPDGLQRDQLLDDLLVTPSTKGIMKNVPGVPEVDDTNIDRLILESNYKKFKFNSLADIDLYEKLLREGFSLIEKKLGILDQLFVDTKFEFGYVKSIDGEDELIYIDEVGTPDSSRIWDGDSYRGGKVIENSKEVFRQLLLNHFPQPEILLNKDRMVERSALARDNALPQAMMKKVSETYITLAEKITGSQLKLSANPREEIIEILSSNYSLI